MRVVKLPKGKYVVAVSGGVDSMALLDMLRRQRGLELVVAHLNHGMRDDAGLDQTLVTHYATSHNLMCVTKTIVLGKGASEEKARQARYKFLRYCREKYKAHTIVTAHHEDDMVETAIINLMRGTGWRGIAPFAASGDIIRPLLQMRKDELIGYARRHNVPWRDEISNTDERYLRNYVRHTLIPTLNQKSGAWRDMLLQQVRNQQQLRRTVEQELEAILGAKSEKFHGQLALDRHMLIMVPPTVAVELLQQALRMLSGNGVQRQLAAQGILFAKTAFPGRIMPLSVYWQLRAAPRELIVEPRSHVVS